jgi:transposase
MLEALLAGVSDPARLAELAKGRLRAKIPHLTEALANRFDTAHHGLLVAGLLAHIDALDQAVAMLDARIAAATDAELVELLSTIPGVKRHTAEVLIAECGPDMSVFGSGQRLVSRAGICPGTNQSGRRRRRSKTRPGNTWPRTALTQAAHAAAHSKNTYLASHDWQLRGRRGEPKSDRRHPPRHPYRLPPHRLRARPLPRARSRPARPPPLARTPHPSTRQTTRRTRPQSHPRDRLTNRSRHNHHRLSGQRPDRPRALPAAAQPRRHSHHRGRWLE